ncbi:hypothetical protein RAS1_19990 [Phycisphaerae bacterium RAS1]|nr:hypothetical protein RAS1_19990 [Phycisphaerae bacterium RAS1]
MIATLLILQLAASTDPVAPMRAQYRERLARHDGLALQVRTNTYTAPLNASPLDRSAWTNCSATPDVIHRVQRRGGIVACDTYAEDHAAPDGVRLIRTSFDGRTAVQGPFTSSDGRRAIYETSDGATRGAFEEGGLCQALEVQLWDPTLPAGYNIADVLSEPDCKLVRRVGGVATFVASRVNPNRTLHFEVDLLADATPARVKITFELPTETVTSEQFIVATRWINGVHVATESVIVNHGFKRVAHRGIYHAVAESVERSDASAEQLRNPIPSRNVIVRRVELQSATPGTYTDEYDAEGRLMRSTKRP